MNIRPLLAVLALSFAGAALAQTAPAEKREAVREKLQNMTPEERAAAKEKARARWEAMTPEEQAAAKKRFEKRHPKAAEKMKEKAASAPQ
jgi:Protein of unknown function (DUF3106)